MVQVVPLTTSPSSGRRPPTQIARVETNSEPKTTVARDWTVIGASSVSKSSPWSIRCVERAFVKRSKRPEIATEEKATVSQIE